MDITAVALPPDIEALVELLARQVHTTWARQRLQDGWRLGPRMNDARKEHPSLVPYDELPESEKQYDRNTAIATLKSIIALGYRIEKSG